MGAIVARAFRAGSAALLRMSMRRKDLRLFLFLALLNLPIAGASASGSSTGAATTPSPVAAGSCAASVCDQARPPIDENTIRGMEGLIRLQVDKATFEELCRRTSLSQGQTRYAESLFAAYRQQLEDASERFFRDITPTAVEFLSALRDGPAPSAEEELQFMKFCERHRKVADRKVSDSLASLLTSLRSSLAESQLEAFDSSVRALRRSLMLNDGSRSSIARNLDHHVDLLATVKDAVAHRQELRPFLCRSETNSGHDACAEARLRCLAVLDDFELQLDSMLPGLFEQQYDIYQRSRQAHAMGNDAAKARFDRQYIRNWMRIYDLNTTTARTLAAIITEAGRADLAADWLDEYFGAYYPTLYRDNGADLAIDWISSNLSPQDDRLYQMQILYDLYDQRRAVLRKDAQTALLDMMESMNVGGGMIALYDSAGRLPKDWYELKAQLRSIDHETCGDFRAMLDEDQQADFDVALAGFRRHLANLE